ncbi:hypothetical protein [Tatumella morbirosei]|uniref:hypothetical protein n=1 Tax=Tatumella morbirosei TaxID=642227 RepID=UPI000B2BCF13|nr:hypothetical protein [Tatumella morbirosei]
MKVSLCDAEVKVSSPDCPVRLADMMKYRWSEEEEYGLSANRMESVMEKEQP